MINFHRFLSLAASGVALCISLSACNSNINLSQYLPVPLDDAETVEAQDNPDADKELEALEPQFGLDEELKAIDELQELTSWSEPQSSSVQEEEKAGLFNFPVVHNKQVEMYIKLYQGRQRKHFVKWLARSKKYNEMMKHEFEQAGLPTDLVYLAMIESGYNPLARSTAKAIGLWQFMKPTGKQYNLQVNKYVDERRDPYKATRAAANYLGDLYKEFGDWHLAVAAYNGGPGKIRSGLRKYKVDNFWDLASKKYLRLETKRYVPKLIATLLIAKEPEKYGFTNIKYQEPLAYDSISVGPNLTLEAVALISNSSVKKIKSLNPELRQSRTPANLARYKVNIPTGSAAVAQKNLSRLHSIVTTGYKTHKIAKNDTIGKICRKYKINKTTLLKVNNLRSSKLQQGKNLRIPYRTIAYHLLPEGSDSALTAYKDSLVLHKIRKGDTIGKIARKYGVPQEMIVSWNGLKNAHTIRAGQQLALYINNGAKPSIKARTAQKGVTAEKAIATVAHSESGNTIVLYSSGKKKHPSFSGGATPRIAGDYLHYKVKTGDSLWTISRKFNATTKEIKRWNNLKSNMIQPGETLKLKKG